MLSSSPEIRSIVNSDAMTANAVINIATITISVKLNLVLMLLVRTDDALRKPLSIFVFRFQTLAMKKVIMLFVTGPQRNAYPIRAISACIQQQCHLFVDGTKLTGSHPKWVCSDVPSQTRVMSVASITVIGISSVSSEGGPLPSRHKQRLSQTESTSPSCPLAIDPPQ